MAKTKITRFSVRAATLLLIAFFIFASLPLPIVNAASLEYELLGTHPQAAVQSTDHGKALHKLQVFNDKIYAGYGDATINTGPVHLNPFDLTSETFSGSVLNVPTEEINLFRIIGDKLYAPSIDRTTCAVCSQGFAVGEPFENKMPVTAAHIMDIGTLNGTDRWLVGSSDTDVDGGHVWRSENGVDGWEVVQTDASVPSPGSGLYAWIATLNGKIYMQANDAYDAEYNPAPVRIFDGENWTTGTTETISEYNRTLVFNNKLITTKNGLSSFDGENLEEITNFPGVAADMYVDDGYLYVLRTNSTLARTNDLQTWQSLGSTVNDASSIAVHDGRVYVGTYNSQLYGSTSPLPEFESDENLVSGESRVAPHFVSKIGSYGVNNISPLALAIDSDNNRYIGDYNSQEIIKLNASGEYLTQFGVSGMQNSAMAVDSNDNVYVADTENSIIHKFSSNGTLLSQIGTPGDGDEDDTVDANGVINEPVGIAIDSNDNIFVSDYGNKRIQKFNSSGVYQSKWGSAGEGDGQFSIMGELAIDSNDNVYVIDMNYNTMAHRIQKFNSAGVYQTQWGDADSGSDYNFNTPTAIAVDNNDLVMVVDQAYGHVRTYNTSGVYQGTISEYGSDDNQLMEPVAIAVSSNNHRFIAQSYSSAPRVKEFDSDGSYVNFTDTRLDNPGQLSSPRKVAVTAEYIYVVDSGNYRIQKFTRSGEYVSQWGRPGTGNGEFDGPSGIAIDEDGNVYVTEIGNDRVQKFTSDGDYINQFGSQGTGDGEFDTATSITFDEAGNIYVVGGDGDNRIQKFDPDGNYVSKFGSYGSGDGQFQGPNDLAFDSSGNIYVADGYNNRIQKFDPDGDYISQWGYTGANNGEFDNPQGIAIDSHDNVYVSDSNNHRVQKFTSDGFFLTTIGESGTEDDEFQHLFGIALASDNELYVVDEGYGDNIGVKRFAYNTVDSLASGDIRVQAPYATNLTCSEKVNASQLDGKDPNAKYPLGLVDFCLEVTTGSTHEMNISFKTDLLPSEVEAKKYDPNSETYFAVDDVTITETTIDGDHGLLFTYQITDGGALDSDGEANGEILDPIGLAVADSDIGSGPDQSGSDTSDPLAKTGDDMKWVKILGIVLVLLGISAAAYSLRKRKK